MLELLPDQLGASSNTKPQGPKMKVTSISSILEWVQCLSIYISVIALKEPQQAPDLLSYMNLIIKVHLEYSGDSWQGYDQHFRQRVAMTTKIQWTTTDLTLWNLAFAGHANAKDANTALASTIRMIVATGHQDQPPHPSATNLPLNLCSLPHDTTTAYALHGTILHP